MSKRSVKLLVEDMLEATGKIERYILGLSREDFMGDEKSIDAVVRNLEIIGEAASRLPSEFKAAHPEIEWAKIAGLRHRVVHEYFGVDLDLVWEILEHDLPPFKRDLQACLPAEM